MKVFMVIILVALLTGCGVPYSMNREFTSACVSHGGVRDIEKKGYGVYVATCKDNTKIKGVVR